MVVDGRLRVVTAPISPFLARRNGDHFIEVWLPGSPMAAVARARDHAKICQRDRHAAMSTMNISLPESLKSFVDEKVASRGFGTSSEYVRGLIRKDLDRQRLRGLLLQGAQSSPAAAAGKGYFDGLRARLRSRRAT